MTSAVALSTCSSGTICPSWALDN